MCFKKYSRRLSPFFPPSLAVKQEAIWELFQCCDQAQKPSQCTFCQVVLQHERGGKTLEPTMFCIEVLQLHNVRECLQSSSKYLNCWPDFPFSNLVFYLYLCSYKVLIIYIFLVMPSSATCNAQNIRRTSLKLFSMIMCKRKQSSK